MRPAHRTLCGIAASCVAMLVAFVATVAWPGLPAQARTPGGTATPSMTLDEGPVAPRLTTVGPQLDDDGPALAADDQIPVALAGGLTVLGAVVVQRTARRHRDRPAARRFASRGREPPAGA